MARFEARGGSHGMAQLSEDCFAFGGALMALDDALRLLDQKLTCIVDEEEVDLRHCLGRVLAEDIGCRGRAAA